MKYSDIKFVEPMITELLSLGGFSIINKNDKYISIRVRNVSKDKCNEYYKKYGLNRNFVCESYQDFEKVIDLGKGETVECCMSYNTIRDRLAISFTLNV